MAIVFELSANFAGDEEAAHRFCRQVAQRSSVLEVSGRAVRLHKPLLSCIRDYEGRPNVEVSLIPAAVGYGVALDRGAERVQLNTEELSQLGSELYELLRGAVGYEVALAGWDVDWVNLAELRREWAEEIIAGSLDGLVVSHEALAGLPASSHFVPFDDDHVWIPYRGTRAL